MADAPVVAHHAVMLDGAERGDVEVDRRGGAVHHQVGRDGVGDLQRVNGCWSGVGVGASLSDGVGHANSQFGVELSAQ